jgi:hypothetical protein
MNTKIILLVTDDSDDHETFSEALTEISSRFLLLAVLNTHTARQLLTSGRLYPDFVFIDISRGEKIDDFITWMQQDHDMKQITLMLYGEDMDDPLARRFHAIPFLVKDFGYSSVVEFLKVATLRVP